MFAIMLGPSPDDAMAPIVSGMIELLRESDGFGVGALCRSEHDIPSGEEPDPKNRKVPVGGPRAENRALFRVFESHRNPNLNGKVHTSRRVSVHGVDEPMSNEKPVVPDGQVRA
jgi:hypothetical protein